MSALIDGPTEYTCGELAVIDSTGDTKTIWDSRNKDEVDAARAQFNALKKKGYLAYTVSKDGGKGEVIHEFDEKLEKVIMSPPMAGG